MLKKLYDQSTPDEKKAILIKLKLLAMPYLTSLKEPIPVIPKGRPQGSKRKLSRKEMKHESSTKRNPSGFEYAKTKEEARLVVTQSSQTNKARKVVIKKKKEEGKADFSQTFFERYLQFIPKIMHPFIADIENVKGDGHCGFRAISEHMGWSEDEKGWLLVRKDLIADLERYKHMYDTVWGDWFYNDNRYILDFFEPICKDDKHWMVMPDMGFLTASAYNCVVVMFSAIQSLTFFPHDEGPREGSDIRVLAIALVHGNHFVKVHLKDDSPLPPVASMWNRLRTEEAAAWEETFANRLILYKEMGNYGVKAKDCPIINKGL